MPSKLVMISWDGNFDGDIDNALPTPPAFPGHALPGRPAHPGNALPPPGSIATLPVFPFDPTVPSNELPGGQPEPDPGPIRPGKKFVVKWLACTGLILVPDNSLPTTPPPTTDNTLPTTPQPK